MCRCVPESGLTKPVPAQWVNDSGRVAHPDSPLGRGGPGNFRAAGVFGGGYSDDLLPSADAPTARSVDPALIALADGEEAKKVVRQPPPKVSADAADEVLHKVLTLKLKADQSKVAGISGAETKFDTVASGKITSKRDEAGKVTSFTNGATWTITLCTRYGTGTPESDSAYGRGTTVSDVQSGHVTLGFHEACHRDTMLAYFRTTVPPTFDGAVGDTGDEFDTKLATFMTAMDAYFEAARTQNVAQVDEVGKPTMSQYFAESE
jgi:hypothetical protein